MPPRTLLDSAKQIRLSPAENGDIRENLMEFMRTHPVTPPAQRPNGASHREGLADTFHSLLLHFRPVPIFTGVLIVFLALGGGLSVAARSALPGDFLYAIKVRVNEPIEAALHLSTDARARFEAARLEIRLEEASRLAAADRLHGDAKAAIAGNIEAQLQRMQSAASSLAAAGNAGAALDLHSQVESDLLANAVILSVLADAGASVKADVQDLLQNVSKAERTVMRSRTAAEAKVTAGAKADVRAAAEGSMTGATNKIEEVRRFIERMIATADADVLAQARARFALSKKILGDARAALNAGDFNEAFRLARSAQRTAQEAQTMLKVSASIHIRGAGAHSRSSATSPAAQGTAPVDTTSQRRRNANASVNAEVKTDVNVKVNGNGVQIEQDGDAGVQIDVDAGL